MFSRNNFYINSKRSFISKLLCGLFAVSALYSSPVFAAKTANESTSDIYQEAARVDVKLGLLTNKKVNVVFRIPSQQAYGFAGEDDTPEQKAAVNSVVDNVKQNISSIVSVDPALKCKYDVNDIDKFSKSTEKYQKKSDVEKKKIKLEYYVLKVDVSLNCEKEMTHQTMNLNFAENFKSINKILVDLKSKQKRKFVIDSSSGNFTL